MPIDIYNRKRKFEPEGYEPLDPLVPHREIGAELGHFPEPFSESEAESLWGSLSFGDPETAEPPTWEEEQFQQFPEPYQRLLTKEMRWGKTRQEIDEELRAARESGAWAGQSTKSASEYLEGLWGQGYREAKEAFVGSEEGKDTHITEAMWQYTPQHLRSRRAGAVKRPMVEDKKTGRKYPGEPPPGYVARGRERHAFPWRSITRASHLARTEEGIHITYDPSKIEKRIQMLYAHEFVDLPNMRPAAMPMKAGPESPGPEKGMYNLRGAYIIGGDAGPAGQGYIDPSVGPISQTIPMEIGPERDPVTGEIIREVEGIAEIGQTFAHGTRAQLAKGATPFETKKWDYTVRDIAPIEEGKNAGGLRYTFERTAPVGLGGVFSKGGGPKTTLAPMDLSGVTDIEGNPLGLQFVAGLKDVQGMVYENFMTERRGELASALGMKESQLPGSYSELGMGPMKKFVDWITDEEGPLKLQTILMPHTLSQQWKERFEETGALHSAEEIEPGLWKSLVKFQAVTGDFAKQLGHQYNVRDPFLSYQELEGLRAQQPDLHARIMHRSAPRRAGYQEMMNAYLASTGEYEMPRGATQVDPERLKAIFEAARVGEREGSGDRTLRQGFMEALAEDPTLGRKPMVFGDTGIVLPSGWTQLRFGATGKWEDEELSKYSRAATEFMAAYAGGAKPEQLQVRAEQLKRVSNEIVGGKDFARKITGAFLGEQGYGGVAYGAFGLGTGEAYVPGMEGKEISLTRFPTAGQRSWMRGLTAIGLTKEQAAKRGITDFSQMHVSTDLQQAMSGDYDGDLDYAISRGDITISDDGKVYDRAGEELNNVAAIREAAQISVMRGAGNVASETAGTPENPQGFMSLVQARNYLANTVYEAEQHPWRDEDLLEEFQKGSELRSRIGPLFNVFERGKAVLGDDPEALEAFETLFEYSHGRAQVPKEQLKAMQKYHQANLSSLANKWGKATSYAFNREAGGMTSMGLLKGASGVQSAIMRSLLELETPEGKPALGAKQFAAYMGTKKRRGDVEKAYRAYRKAQGSGGDVETAMADLSMSLGPAGEWGLLAPGGRVAMSAAVHRALESGKVKSTADFEQLTEPQAALLAMLGERGEQRITALRRETKETPGAIIEQVEAIRNLPNIPESTFVSRLEDVDAPTAEEGVGALPVQEAGRVDLKRAGERVLMQPQAGGGGRGAKEPPRTTPAAAYGDIQPEEEPPPYVGSGAPPPSGTQRSEPHPYDTHERVVSGGGPGPGPGEDPSSTGQAMPPGVEEGWEDQSRMWIRDATGNLRSVSISGGGALVAQRKLGPEQLEELQGIAGRIRAWAPKYKSMMAKQGRLTQDEARGLRRMGQLYKSARRYNWMERSTGGTPLGIETAETFKSIEPHMEWMQNIESRLDYEAMSAGAASPAAPVWGMLDELSSGQLSRAAGVSRGTAARALASHQIGRLQIGGPADPMEALRGGVGEEAAGRIAGAVTGGTAPEELKLFAQELNRARKVVKEYGGEMEGLLRTRKSLTGKEGERVGAYEAEIRDIESLRKEALKRGAPRAFMEQYQDVFQGAESWRGAQAAATREGRLAKLAGGGGGLFGGLFGGGVDVQKAGFGDLGPAGKAAGALHRFTSGWELMRLQRLWNMTGAPVFQQYMPAAAQEGLARAGAVRDMGGVPEGEMIGGVAGDLMQLQAERQRGMVQAGEAGARAWGWTQQAFGGVGREVEGIMRPAIGAGLVVGGIGSTMGVLGGMGTAAAATGIGLPVTLGVGALAATVGYGAYSYNLAEGEPSTALEAHRLKSGGDGGLGDRLSGGWQRVSLGVGTMLRGTEEILTEGGTYKDTLSMVLSSLAKQDTLSEAGEELAETTFGDMSPQERAGGMKYMLQKIRDYSKLQGGSAWDLIGDEQAYGIMGQMSQFYDMEGLAPEDAATGLGPDWLRQAVETGSTPEEFTQLSQQLSLGAGGAQQLWERYGRLGRMEKRSLSATLGQYGSIATRMGVGQKLIEMYDQDQLARLTGPEQYRLQAAAGGERNIWSQIGRQVGDERLITMDETGLPLHTGQLWDIQDEMTNQQRGYRDQGIARRQAQLGWSAQMQWGTGTAVNPAAGSMFAIQDQRTSLGFQNQMAGLDYQQQMFGVQNRQWLENWQLSKQQFESRVGWQQQDMSKQEGRAETLYGWRMQDWSYGEDVSQLKFGWGLEDIEEQMQFATGRDKLKLQKKRERTTILESMRREHSEDEKDRIEERRQWEEEDFETQKERNEELTQLQRQRFDMQKRHHDESAGLQQANMDRVRAYYQESHELQQQMTNLQRQNAQKQHQWQLEALNDQIKLNAEMDVLQDTQRDLVRDQQLVVANWQKLLLNFEELAPYLEDVLGVVTGGVTTPPVYTPPPDATPDDPWGDVYGTKAKAATTSMNITIHAPGGDPQAIADAIRDMGTNHMGLNSYDLAFAE